MLGINSPLADLLEPDTYHLHKILEQYSKLEFCCSSKAARNAAIALGLTIPKLHPADVAAKSAAAHSLAGILMNGKEAGSLRAACAEGLGLAINGLASVISDKATPTTTWRVLYRSAHKLIFFVPMPKHKIISSGLCQSLQSLQVDQSRLVLIL